MNFSADPMFPGDLFEAASRYAADMSAGATRQDAWRQAMAMGWPALLVDEIHGGAGGTLADLGAVIEGCARQTLGLPLIQRCAMAPTLLLACGTVSSLEALAALCAGEIDLDVAEAPSVVAVPDATGGVRLNGLLEGVDAELPFTHVLVLAGEHVLLLPQATLPAASARHVSIDGRAVADLALQDLCVPASAVMLVGHEAGGAWAAAQDIAMLATAIDMAATLGASIEHSIAYLSTRVQFGVALSTFQVLRHKVVDLYVQYESASVLLSRLVSDSVARGSLARRDAALCKLYLNDLARKGAETSIQLHGGMGMTAELPAARLARRLLTAEFERGDRLQQLETLRALPHPDETAPA